MFSLCWIIIASYGLYCMECRSLCCFLFFFLMIRRPPRSTRTDTLFPYTTLFRSKSTIAPKIEITVLNSGKISNENTPIPSKITSGSSTIVRSEEHTSELQSLMRISYAVFRLKKKKHIILLHQHYIKSILDHDIHLKLPLIQSLNTN